MLDGDAAGCAAAAVDGSAADGSDDAGLEAAPLVPDIAAAKAVTCVLTSINFDFVVSSSVIAALEPDFALVAPVVPVGALAPLAEAGPSSSVRILSIAATSLLQLFFERAVVFDPCALAPVDVLGAAVAFSSAFR